MGDCRHLQLFGIADSHHWGDALGLLRQYLATLVPEVSRQELSDEMGDLPRAYGGEGRCFWLAQVDGLTVACAGLRPLPSEVDANACEMKRLFVVPALRGFGVGRRLAAALIDEARAMGYSTIYLDTLSDMAAARGLYESLGFEPTEPWVHDPLAGAHHFRLDLDRANSRF